MIGMFFPNAVVQAMTLLDECADDKEVAQMFVRTRLFGTDPEEIVGWGELLEALRRHERNQA
jgi:hypothetical protein